MQEKIDRLLHLNSYHWGDSNYQWFFYASILIILFTEKRKMLKIVFGWVPILYLVAIFNPIMQKLLSLTGQFNDAYFARFFSFMPIMYVITHGFLLVIRYIQAWNGKIVKAAVVIIVCLIICLNGNNIYRQEWFIKAVNFEKVPEDTFEILEVIKAEEPIKIAAIDAPVYYLRQVENVITPYARYMGELGNQLAADPPDVQNVMEMAGKQDIDFIVTHNTESTLTSFEEKSYLPYALTRNYAIYQVEKVNRLSQSFNEKRQVVLQMEYDCEGEPIEKKSGVYAYAFDYDADGRVSSFTRLDESGNPTNVGYVCSTVKRTYYKNGDIKTIEYIDKTGEPILKDGRYKTEFAYNLKHMIIKEKYYDKYGKLMKRADCNYAMCEMSYLSSGKLSEMCFFDEFGKSILSDAGFARLTREYNDEQQFVCESYYDTEGNMVGIVGTHVPIKVRLFDNFLYKTIGTTAKENSIVFKSVYGNNRFNSVRLRIYDADTNSFMGDMCIAKEQGVVSGEYINQLPSGIYKIVLTSYGNVEDECMSCNEYLQEGERLYYRFCIDELQPQRVEISDFYLGRSKT